MGTYASFRRRWIFFQMSLIISALSFPWALRTQTPFTCADQFFLTLSLPPTSLNEVVIDPQTNNVVFQQINSNVGIEVNAAGFRSTDNFIYCIAPFTRQLVRIDANGNSQVLATLPLKINLAYFAGDITPDGRYLIVIGTATSANNFSYAAELSRIDLDSPTFEVTNLDLNTNALIFDIAFNPLTGVLYGYDSNGQRLVRIDPNTGAVNFPFQPVNAPAVSGSLFFDAFGNLFAYGSAAVGLSDIQNRLYEISTANGSTRLLTQGEQATSSDGCSCPYTVQLLKTVSRLTAFPCTEVEYTFTIANTSGRGQQGLRLEDVLPPGFTFARVVSNPLGGTVLSQPGDDRFILENIGMTPGTFEIKIAVNTGPAAPGIYKNQATLYGLPASLGSKRLSDNPRTLVKGDSTELQILELPLDTVWVDTALCAGSDFVRLDAGRYLGAFAAEAAYRWQDGSTASTFDAPTGGNYRATATLGCDTTFVFFTVEPSDIDVDLVTDSYTIRLGDSLYLEAFAYTFGAESIAYNWLDPEPGSIRCPTCAESWAQPFNDLEYIIEARNEWGCLDTAVARVLVEKNRSVYFPNAIRPETSTDNANGYFFASGEASSTVQWLGIYSRWGELLFETRETALNDPLAGWDGSFRGQPMQPGVYAWLAIIRHLDGVTVQYAGDVTVVR